MTERQGEASGSRTPLLLHYHIFKNAGSSIDRMLAENFGDAWLNREFESGNRAERNAEVATFLAASPQLKAMSSHTSPLPVPDVPGRVVFPIIFIRHPLLRIRSTYHFNRWQTSDTQSAVLAKATDLRGYVEAILANPEGRQVRDFQMLRFAAGSPGRPRDALRRAEETIARLPFVGLVEAFEESIVRLGELVRPLFPEFRPIAFHENAVGSPVPLTIDQALERVRDELGSTLYDRLLVENARDLALFTHVRQSYRTAR